MTCNITCASPRDRVFAALIHTEQERVGAGLMDTWEWRGFPFSCCEATKYEIFGRLSDSQRPSLLIALTMEIPCFPSICGGIKNPLESGARKLVSDEFDDHLPSGRGPKGLGSSKIFLGVIFQIRDAKDRLKNSYFGYLLSFGLFRDWLRLRLTQQFLGLLEVSLRFGELLRKLFEFLFRFL